MGKTQHVISNKFFGSQQCKFNAADNYYSFTVSLSDLFLHPKTLGTGLK